MYLWRDSIKPHIQWLISIPWTGGCQAAQQHLLRRGRGWYPRWRWEGHRVASFWNLKLSRITILKKLGHQQNCREDDFYSLAVGLFFSGCKTDDTSLWGCVMNVSMVLGMRVFCFSLRSQPKFEKSFEMENLLCGNLTVRSLKMMGK